MFNCFILTYVDVDDPDTARVLRHIELIDDEAAEYGIKIVKCNDKLMAKKYGYRNPPGVSYFRKGKLINYDGNLISFQFKRLRPIVTIVGNITVNIDL